MLAEAISKIQQLVGYAEQARTFTVPCEPPHVYYLQHGQTVQKVEASLPLRHATLTTLFSFVRHAVEESHDSIWVGDNKIISRADSTGETGTFHLKPSPQLELLRRLESSVTYYKQKDLIHLLRRYFPDIEASVIQPFRMVKFRSDQTGESSIDHGKASVGKSLKAELVGAVAIPEEISVYFPVFASGQPACIANVALNVEIDLDKEQFALFPSAGMMATIYDEHISHLADGIVKDLTKATGKSPPDIPLYRGLPA